MALTPGATFGPYRIIEPLGRGGMASVFKAYEAALDRYVALKVLPGEFLHDESFAERFRREARVIARLEHPSIVPIHAFGIEGTVPWMAMRLIPGGTLSGLIRSGPALPHARVVVILRGVADALDYAHGKGVVHRDIKPQNVLLDEGGRTYLADFGIARMVEGTGALTQTGMITGTPQYMAPEQATGRSVDHRCDIYALGVVAYEMLVGRVPFSADTPVAVLMKHVSDPIPLPPAEQVPEPLVRALLKALAKSPDDRWPSAGAFVQALEMGLGLSASIAAVEPPPAGEEEGLPTLYPEPTLAPAPRTAVREAAPSSLVTPSTRVAGPRTVLDATGVPVSSRRAGAGALLGLGIAAVVALIAIAVGAYLLLMRRAVGPDPSPAPPPTLARGSAVPRPAPSVAPPRFADEPPPAPPPDAWSPPPRERSRPTPAVTPAARAAGVGPLTDPTPETRTETSRAPEPVRETAVSRGTLRLDVDATQDPYVSGTGVLYLQVSVDGRAVRNATVVFSGRDAFARSRRRETVDVEGVPVGRRRVTVAVSPDQEMQAERVEGAAELTVEEGVNRAVVQVRYLGRGAREVRFR